MADVFTKVLDVSEYLAHNDDGTVKVPVNLGPVLDKYGLSAYNVRFDGLPDVAGAFDRSEKAIYINETDPQTRKIFTLAHELGHYFLHSDVERDVLFRERTMVGHREVIEREADCFAAEILMPEAAIRKYWTVAESIQQMADFFAVSYSAMRNRLRNLGFI